MEKEQKIALYLTGAAVVVLISFAILFVMFPKALWGLLWFALFSLLVFSLYMVIFNIVDGLHFDTLGKLAKFFRIKD